MICYRSTLIRAILYLKSAQSAVQKSFETFFETSFYISMQQRLRRTLVRSYLNAAKRKRNILTLATAIIAQSRLN